jgi:hypothetical protein
MLTFCPRTTGHDADSARLAPRQRRRGPSGDLAMILGVFDLHAYTILHVIISLIAIAAGFVVVFGMLRSQHMEGWTATFLITTILTSLTGFAFPFLKFTPAHAVGAISMVVLLLACLAFYFYRLAGNWRWIYVVGAVAALWFNVFVLIVQAFQKVSVLQPLAPTQSEPPFQIVQGLVLVAFIVLGWLAARRYHPPAAA